MPLVRFLFVYKILPIEKLLSIIGEEQIQNVQWVIMERCAIYVIHFPLKMEFIMPDLDLTTVLHAVLYHYRY